MSALVLARFTVSADADPGLLSRLLEPLAKRGLVPDVVHAVRQDSRLRVEIAAPMPADIAPLVAGNLGSVIGLHALEWDVLPRSLAA